MRGWIVMALVSAGVASAQPKPDPEVVVNLSPPAVEAAQPARPITTPPLPAFDVPPPNPDGSHTVREMRIHSRLYLDSVVTIKGFVTWRYDCLADVRQPGETDRQAQKRIDEDPTLCERPKFYLGDTAMTKSDVSIWVVDVPRVYNKLELQRIKKKDRTDPDKCEPNETDKKKKVCPPYAVGDQIEITGTWKQASPHSERNSDGLLVYGRMKNVTQNWESPGAMPPGVQTAAINIKPWVDPPLRAVKNPPPVKTKASQLAESQRHAADGDKAAANKQWSQAVASYLKATIALPANHVAFHGLAKAYAMRGEWTDAVRAAQQAQALAPNAASYRESLGRALYEKTIADARLDIARKTNQKPDVVDLDLSALGFDAALEELRYAVSIEPKAWRAHYLIGAIHRNARRAGPAAKALTQAIALGAPEAAPWVALAELYRSWDYTDQAVAVAEQGASIVVGTESQAQLWFTLGSAYEDKMLADKAIEALTKALDSKPDLHRARYLRGQVLFRQGNFAKAKADLEAFVNAAGVRDDFYKHQASRMLMDIAAKTAPP